MTDQTTRRAPATSADQTSDLGPDLGLDLGRIAHAATTIDPVFRDSPQYADEQLCARLGRRVITKVETLNPLRSFKGRGADHLVGALTQGSAVGSGAVSTVVCASGGGNFGQAIAYAARRHGLNADVFVPAGTSQIKTRRMETFGARVHRVEGSHKDHAAAYAAQAPGRYYAVDGSDTAVYEGNATIGVELLRGEPFDTLVVPVGDGALIAGVARWVKAHAPHVHIVGVTSAAAPALQRSWQTGERVAVEHGATIAAGISISRPEPEAVVRTRALVDDFLLIDDDELLAAMHLAAETLGVLLEPAGAAALAAVAARGIPGESIATVLTGANADLGLYRLNGAPALR
ncbi:threonine/serine dehydratase [Spirillospora sp. NPDC048911]|uniref:threonine ammonia-lyase n=1 Tax=Spirillospora sp. NPDC048911 TaxID=3364527 RepID=UPI0037235B57